MNDAIHHPAHYTQGEIECIEAIEHVTKHLHGKQAVCVANIIKYTWRCNQKNGKEDLEKAQWYANRLCGIDLLD